MNSFHARKIISWLMKKQNFNEIKVVCEIPMDRSQQFLRDRDASSTSLPAHVLAFKIIYKQVPELMEPFLCVVHNITDSYQDPNRINFLRRWRWKARFIPKGAIYVGLSSSDLMYRAGTNGAWGIWCSGQRRTVKEQQPCCP